MEVDAVFENERLLPLRGWSASNLLPTDRRRFSGPRGSNTTTFPNISLPAGKWAKICFANVCSNNVVTFELALLVSSLVSLPQMKQTYCEQAGSGMGLGRLTKQVTQMQTAGHMQ